MAAQFDEAGQAGDSHVGDNMRGIHDLPPAFGQPIVNALLHDPLEDLPELLFAKAYRPEVGDGGVIRHLFIYRQPEEVLVGEVEAGILYDVSVRVTVEILEEAQPEHEFRVFSRPSEVGSASVPDEFIDERKVDHLIDLA